MLFRSETVEHNRDKSLVVTVYLGSKTGSASTSDFTPRAVEESVRAACAIARYTAEDDCAGLADAELIATEVTDEMRRYLKIAPDSDTDPERLFTIDRVACVGCCTLAPILVIEDEPVGKLSPAAALEAIEAYRQEHHR